MKLSSFRSLTTPKPRVVVPTLLACGLLVSVAHADSSPQTLPYSQNWSNTGLITANNNWDGVPGVIGYRGDNLTTVVGTDPQTTLVDGSATPVNVSANATDTAAGGGGIYEFESGTGIGSNPVVGFQGSATADAPHIVITLDTRQNTNIQVAYLLRDVDNAAPVTAAVQQIALQYRVGTTGNFTNVPAAFVANANNGSSTSVSVSLPSNVDNQAVVQLRIITNDAGGSDNMVGIDDISVTGTFTNSGGNPPVATDDTFTINEDSGANGFDVLGNTTPNGADSDIDGDTLTISAVTNGTKGTATINSTSDGVIYTPNPGSNGTDTFTYTISDGNGNNDTATVTVNITSSPDAPVAADDAYQAIGGQALNIAAPGVLGNDSDQDGDTLSAVLVNGPSNASAFSLNANGSFSYTANVGFTGPDSFTYKVSDGNGPDSNPVTVTLNVVAPLTLYLNEVFPDSPGADGFNEYVELRGTPGAVIPSGVYLLSIEGDGSASGVIDRVIDLSGLTIGSNGFLVLVQDGNSYNIAPGANVSNILNGAQFENDSNTFAIVRTPTAPVVNTDLDANNDGVYDVAGYTGTNEVDSVSFIDTDSADRAYGRITFITTANTSSDSVIAPQSQTVVRAATGFNYAGRAGDTTGSAAADWVAGDTTGATPNFTLLAGSTTPASYDGRALDHVGSTNFPAPNNTPVANDDTYSTAYQTALNVNAGTGVLFNDTDQDGNPLTAAVLSGPANASAFTLNADGSFSYTPNTGFSGDDTFTYTVSDGQGGTDTGSVTITVATPVNNAPVAVLDTYSTTIGTPLTVNAATGVLLNDTDQDGNTLSAVLVSGPSNASAFTLNSDGSFSYTPNGAFSGTDSFIYKANDGQADSNTVTVNITVAAPGAPTNLTLSRNSVPENQPVGTFVGAFTTTDPTTGDTFTYLLVGGDTSAFSIDGAILRTNAIFSEATKASYSITVRTTDAGNQFFEQTFNITVLEATKPIVAISSPTMNQKVLIGAFTGNIISGTAGDNKGVTGVKVRLGRKRGTVNEYWNGTDFVATQSLLNATVTNPGDPSATWTLNGQLPPAGKLDSGLYNVQVSAVDAAGNKSAYANGSFTLQSDNVAPSLAISTPTLSQKVLIGSFAVNGTASDDQSVSAVKVRLSRKRGTTNTYWNGTDFVTTPSVVDALVTGNTWNLGNQTPSAGKLDTGAYQVEAYALDGAGNKSTTSKVSFTISSDFTAPSVSISTPTSSQVVGINALTAGALTGTAQDNLGVTSVKLKLQRKRNDVFEYWNGTAFTATPTIFDATVTGSTSATWSYDTAISASALDAGGYTLYATAYDAAGNLKTSTSRAFFIKAAPSTTGSASADASSANGS